MGGGNIEEQDVLLLNMAPAVHSCFLIPSIILAYILLVCLVPNFKKLKSNILTIFKSELFPLNLIYPPIYVEIALLHHWSYFAP